MSLTYFTAALVLLCGCLYDGIAVVAGVVGKTNINVPNVKKKEDLARF